MRGSERLILLGILIAFIGFFMIALSSSTEGSGFFFIFPFVFIGDVSTPFMILVFASIALIFLAFFLLPLRSLSKQWKEQKQDEIPKFVRLASKCEYCSKPIPEHSSFCPTCGSPVREDSSEGYEPMY